MGNKVYKITQKRLIDLLECEARLRALESGGVDNWEWYGESLRDGLETIIEEDLELKTHIKGMVAEGNLYYEDDFDYSDYAEWALNEFSEVQEQ